MKFLNSNKQIVAGVVTRRKCSTSPITIRLILICLATLIAASILNHQPTVVEALWLFQQPSSSSSSSSSTSAGDQTEQAQSSQQIVSQEISGNEGGAQQVKQTGSSYASYGSTLLSIAGIQPSSIASLLNTVGDTGFRYFNIQDQCRNRAACDLGSMLFKKLSFVHNWLIRTSVRTLTDMNNVYTQSWMEGMLGKNCTAVYATCRESPLEGIMNLAMLQHLAST